MTVNFITSAFITAAASTVVARRTRLSGMSISSPAGGDYIFRDGGAGGSIKMKLTLPGGMIEPYDLKIPGLGILFATDLYLEIPGGYVTIFHD